MIKIMEEFKIKKAGKEAKKQKESPVESFRGDIKYFKNIYSFFSELRNQVKSEKIPQEKQNIFLNKIDILQSKLKLFISKEGLEYLDNLSQDLIKKFFTWYLRHLFATNVTDLDINHNPYSKINMENLILSLQVWGYDNPDLKNREKINPTPTTEEVFMGCYIEQIENQTRKSVQILREKGYNTIESGFYGPGREQGDQFFHIASEKNLIFDPNILKEIEEKYSVNISVEHRKGDWWIQFHNIGKNIKSLIMWEECLTEFAKKSPKIGDVDFAISIDFLLKVIKDFSKTEILKSAKTDHEKLLIEKLYECQSEEDIKRLIKFDDIDNDFS